MNITRLRIPTGGRQTSWLFTSVAEKLYSGLPRTTSASGQNGIWTRDLPNFKSFCSAIVLRVTNAFVRIIYRLCTGTRCVITGWGRTRQGGTTSPVLREAKVPIISEKDCKSNYRPELITSNMICAGFSGGGIDACQGDSGGKIGVPVRPTP